MLGGSYPCSISEDKIERQANPARTIANLSMPSIAMFARYKSLWAHRSLWAHSYLREHVSLLGDDAFVFCLQAFIVQLSTSQQNQRGFGSRVRP